MILEPVVGISKVLPSDVIIIDFCLAHLPGKPTSIRSVDVHRSKIASSFSNLLQSWMKEPNVELLSHRFFDEEAAEVQLRFFFSSFGRLTLAVLPRDVLLLGFGDLLKTVHFC